MGNKECALCSCGIEHIKEPALLFIGKYGRRYEICLDCEKTMDTLVSSETPEERDDAIKTVYHHLFEDGSSQKSPELLNFFNRLLGDSETMNEARENLEEYEAEEAAKQAEAEAIANAALDTAEAAAQDAASDEISEEEFLAQGDKPLKLWVKLLFFTLFLVLSGVAIAFGVVKSNIPMIVIGAVVFLIGVGTLFSKE